MSDTPKTDAFREVIFAQYKEDELTGDGMGNILAAITDIETLERKRECECKCDVDWPEEYYELRQRLERERDEQCRLLGMSAERECDLRGKLDRERALADRLAEAIQNHLELDQNIDATLDELNNAWECLQSSITAWKEVRND